MSIAARSPIRSPLHHAAPLLRAIAFWLAVALPFAYVPPLLGVAPTTTLFVVLAVHAGCLVVGHEYHPRSRADGSRPSVP
ncbi:hypothetical protein Halru_0979 [Halovivax ruber XH-70]|uniref:Uncharacterized protein n=1 Tax=Halovivax ruber (strain DSM 18193 / JCM 13892 / XH-70) TaxID=797302 RepID=L0I9U4_HALRX|nr:hypothetical protein Halru_0979 [Halovivax ruber XH-70]